jgi:hypothetical protein
MSLEQKQFFEAGTRAERARIVAVLEGLLADYELDGGPSSERVLLLRGVIDDLENDDE